MTCRKVALSAGKTDKAEPNERVGSGELEIEMEVLQVPRGGCERGSLSEQPGVLQAHCGQNGGGGDLIGL